MATLSQEKLVDDEIDPGFFSASLPLLRLSFLRRQHLDLNLLGACLEDHGIILDLASVDHSDAQSCLERLAGCKTYGDVLSIFPPVEGEDERRMMLQQIREQDMEAARRAWKIEYIVPKNALTYVAAQLRNYANLWNRNERYAPLVALVQSSGWGKSRLVCELWREKFMVFYISCLGDKLTGFPRRTEHLADVMQNPHSKEKTFVALVSSIMAVLRNHIDMTCQEWIQAQQTDGSLHTEVHKNFEVNNQKIAEFSKNKEDQYEDLFKEGLEVLKERGMVLLLCVDEAGELGDNFVKFRRSLRCIPKGRGFISVVLGTDRKVADLASAAEEDDSARVRLTFPLTVYHPIYLIGKSDIFVRAAACSSSEASTSSSSDIDTDIDINIDPEHVIRYGRPLWAAYYDSVEAVAKLDATIQLAKMKLLGKNIDITKPGWVTRDVAIAVFACIVGLDVVAWGSLPPQLVAKHMRTIVKISEDRRRVYTASAVEPALAAAAAELLHANNDEFLGEFLDRLAEVCVDGLVQEGVRGEIVSRIVIMLAMHECTRSHHYIQTVKMETFFMTMFGRNTVEELEANNANMEAILFFNSFTPTTQEVSQELVDAGFAKCTALVARRNERILDMALPGRLEPSVGLPERPSLPRAVKKELEFFSPVYHGVTVPTQAKNQRDDKKSYNEAIDKLQNDTRVDSCAEFFFQIGHRGNPEIKVEHNTVVAYGLACFEHLKSKEMQLQNVLSKLVYLSRACEDVFKDASTDEKAVLTDMIPMGYKSKTFVEDIGEEVEDDDASIWTMTWKEKGRRTRKRRHG